MEAAGGNVTFATDPRDPSVTGTRARAQRLLPVLALAALAFVVALVVRQSLMPLGTGNADEGIYTYQATLLQQGEVTISAADHEPFFRPWLTGSRDGQLFFQYEPAWPTVLAVSDTIFGSFDVGVALCFAGLVIAIYALATEALRSRRSALTAAAFAVLTPMFVWQSAMHLSYLFTAMLATFALASAFRAARTDATPYWVTTGALLGVMLLTRPFDGVITAAAVGLIGLFVNRNGPITARVRSGLFVVAGALPFVALALLYNELTTGSWQSFPLTASDPMNRFGFGDRRMQIGADVIDYSSDVAFESLWDNLRGGVGWIFGGPIAVGLAVWAVSFREHRTERLVLGAFFIAFPLGYLFWWATSLAATGATNGMGPHYYVPAFVPLAILAADGCARLTQRYLMAAGLLIPAMLAITFYQLPDKIESTRALSDYFERVEAAAAQAPPDSIVFMRAPEPAGFVIVQFPFLLNDPDLDDDVLYAVDLGPEDARLIAARSDRRVFLLHQQAENDDDIFDPGWTLTELWVDTNPEIALRIERGVRGLYSQDDAGNEKSETLNSTGPIDITVGLGLSCDEESARRICLDPGANEIVVGVELATGERWQRRYQVLVEPDGSYVVHPGTGQRVIDFGNGPVLVNADVDDVIRDAGSP
jgi:hypothetical protein